MTEKLYYNDAYIKEFRATVLSVEKEENGYSVVLDKTAFFPEEGGQYSDRGFIGDARVDIVKESEGIIYHYTDKAPTVGDELLCKIDFEERYEKMQCHSGEHILSGLIHELYGLDNVGFHLGAVDVTMDVSAPLTREQLDRVELLANEIIYKNVEITTEFPTSDELPNMEYRAKLDLTENVRIVRIGEYDACACCAPHVKYTGEIGVIKILDFAKLRGGIRIHITAGRRALREFRELYNSVGAVSALLSVPKSDIGEGTERLLSALSDEKARFSEYRLKRMKDEAGILSRTDGNLVKVFPDAAMDELIAFANLATDKVSGALVLLSGSDGAYKYVISSSSLDLRLFVKDINKSLLGRGGGKPNMIQGSFSSSLSEIEEYFS
jgi:alanyl-tRNA synthetase